MMVSLWRILMCVVLLSSCLLSACLEQGDTVITLEDGASITVPQGAVGRDATITATKLDPEDGPEVPEGFTIETLYEFSVDEPLGKPVTLRLPLGIVTDDSVLWLAKYSEADGEWQGVGFAIEDGYAVVETDSLSIFATIRGTWEDFADWTVKTAGSAVWWSRENILPYLTIDRYVSWFEGIVGMDKYLCTPLYATSVELHYDDTGSRGLISASAAVIGEDSFNLRIRNDTKMYLHVYFDGASVVQRGGAYLSAGDIVTVGKLGLTPGMDSLLSASFTSDSVVLLPDCTSDFRVHMNREDVLQIRAESSHASTLLNGLDPAFALVPVADSELFTALRDVGLAQDDFYAVLDEYQGEWITQTCYFLGVVHQGLRAGYVMGRNALMDLLGYLLGGVPQVAELIDKSAERVEEIIDKGGDADLGGTIVVSYLDTIQPGEYTLSISSTTGGSVVTPGEGTFMHQAGTVVSLVATPANAYQFGGWTGDVETIADVAAAATTVTMHGDYSITASFSEHSAVVPAALSFTSLTPEAITTSSSTYDAVLSASGTNFNHVNRVTLTWSGPDSGTQTWDKGDESNLVEVNSDSSMTLRPRVLVNETATQAQTWTWTVTLRDTTGATASRTFTVTYSPESDSAPTGCSVTKSQSGGNTGSYGVRATCFTSYGWATPLAPNDDGNLYTSTAFDYDSPHYYATHKFRHGGVDWVGRHETTYSSATPVYAIGDGTVRHIRKDDHATENNSRLHIEHAAADGTRFLAIYGHTYASDGLSVGKDVDKGQQIGTLRLYNEYHLHFELNTILTTTTYGEKRAGTVNPLQFLIDHPAVKVDHLATKSLDIILNIDRSGSMSGRKMADAKSAANRLVEMISPQDRVGLVSFASSATLDIGLTSDRGDVKTAIAGCTASGGTNMGDALDKAIKELMTNGREDGVLSIVYFTDGVTNTGPSKSHILNTLVPEAADARIIIYTLGYGSNVDGGFLRQVAEGTGGKYYFAPDFAKLMEVYTELSQQVRGIGKVAEFRGSVQAGDVEQERFLLEFKALFMKVFLLWPGSDLDLAIVDPSGRRLMPGPKVIYSGSDTLPEYYEIYDPQPGEWTIEIHGIDVTGEAEDYTVMIFRPEALMQVRPTNCAVDYSDSRRATITVREVAGMVDLENVEFTVSDLTGSGETVIPAKRVSFSPNEFTIRAGDTTNVQMTVRVPRGTPIGDYTGTIDVTSGDSTATIGLVVHITSEDTALLTGPLWALIGMIIAVVVVVRLVVVFTVRSEPVPVGLPGGSSCPNCGALSVSGASFCPSCASKLESTSGRTNERIALVCSKCGYRNIPDARFCQYCGTPLA